MAEIPSPLTSRPTCAQHPTLNLDLILSDAVDKTTTKLPETLPYIAPLDSDISQGIEIILTAYPLILDLIPRKALVEEFRKKWIEEVSSRYYWDDVFGEYELKDENIIPEAFMVMLAS